MQWAGGVPSAPPVLRARLAESRARCAELKSEVAAAVAVHREALAFLFASVSADTDFWDFNEIANVFRSESGCSALRHEVRDLHEVLAVIDEPTGQLTRR